MNEKRIFNRVPLKTKVFFEDEFGEPFIWLETRDISLGGLFVKGEIPIRIGSQTFLSLTINNQKITATAQVARVPEGGLGLKFMGLSKEASELVRKYVEGK